MKRYAVVIMDIVASRKIKERKRLQERLLTYIGQVNEEHRAVLVAPVSITTGDEWQLITDTPSESYKLVHGFQSRLWDDGVEIYAGIGVGGLTTEIYRDIRAMDGPCFHRARRALEIIKRPAKAKKRFVFSKKNRVFFLAREETLEFYKEDIPPLPGRFNGWGGELGAEAVPRSDDPLNPALEMVINTLIENTEILLGRMTAKQRKIYRDYLKSDSYRKIIEYYGEDSRETPAGISQKLNNAEYFTIQHNHNMIRYLLSYYDG